MWVIDYLTDKAKTTYFSKINYESYHTVTNHGPITNW